LEGDVSGAIACEHIDPAVMSNLNDYTFHTHPNGEIDYPSDTDIDTTTKLKKDWLLIGVARKNKVVAYHKSDGFKQKVAEF
jgi:proteasome lid subunit RPN8/RPN11